MPIYNADGLSDKDYILTLQSFIDSALLRDAYLRKDLRKRAERLRDAINSIDSYIQSNTSAVCPHCTKVCCINRHSYYEFEDLIYLRALGVSMPTHNYHLSETMPCQFLGEYGCSIERYIRPFRCNWYFCVPLIEYMQKGSGRDYRQFSSKLHSAIEIRRELINTFRISTEV